MSNIMMLGTFHPYRGGIASFNESLAHTFLAQGENVEIMTFKLQYPSFLFPGKTQYTNSEAPKDLDITRELNSINPFNWLKVGLKIRKKRPDMLFVRYWTPYLSPALGTVCRIARSKNIKIICLADNIVPHESHFYDNILTRYFVEGVDGFLCMSQQVCDELHRIAPKKPSVYQPHPIYNVYGDKIDRSQAAKRLNLKPDCQYALFFGLIREYKGLDLLLDAWSLFKQNDISKDTKLIIAGEFYGNREFYLSLIDRLSLNDDIILHDHFIADNKVKEYFSLVDVVVQPYKSATQSGITQIAYNFDTPMIVTNVGGLSEIVPNGKVGFVVEKSPESISEAIIKFYSENLKEEFSSNIAVEKQRFSWNAMADKIIYLYKSLV